MFPASKNRKLQRVGFNLTGASCPGGPASSLRQTSKKSFIGPFQDRQDRAKAAKNQVTDPLIKTQRQPRHSTIIKKSRSLRAEEKEKSLGSESTRSWQESRRKRTSRKNKPHIESVSSRSLGTVREK